LALTAKCEADRSHSNGLKGRVPSAELRVGPLDPGVREVGLSAVDGIDGRDVTDLYIDE
jgi:hypothetical protein